MTGVFDDHLSLDAIVAYADGEMSLTSYQRAAAHLTRCAACAADVAEQTAASEYIRRACMPTMSGSLFDTLKSIPIALPPTGPVPGVMVDSVSGRTMRTHEHPEHGRGRRFRLGAGALVAGLAVGAVVVVAAGDNNPAGPLPVANRPDRVASSKPALSTHTTVVEVLARSSSTTR